MLRLVSGRQKAALQRSYVHQGKYPARMLCLTQISHALIPVAASAAAKAFSAVQNQIQTIIRAT